jgi:hypothetical protein
MAYTKTNWVDNVTLVAAAPMNNIENGIAATDSSVTSLTGGKQNVISYGTTPPVTPADGDLWCLPVDTTNGVMWMFRYRAASASVYKWEFVGGSSLIASVLAAENISTSGAFVNAATVGPAIVVPRAGDYDLQGRVRLNKSAADTQIQFTVGIGDHNGSGQTVSGVTSSYAANAFTLPFSRGPFTGLAASTELRMKYFQAAAGTLTIADRFLWLLPLRIS